MVVQLGKLVENGQLIVPQGNYFVMGTIGTTVTTAATGDSCRRAISWKAAVDLLVGERGRCEGPAPGSWQAGWRTYVRVTHIFQITRWNRTLRLVN